MGKFKRLFGDVPIRAKLTILSTLTTGAALLLTCAAFLATDIYFSWKETSKNLTIMAKVIGDNSRSAILFNDSSYAEATLATLDPQENIVAAALYDKEGSLFSSYRRSSVSESDLPKKPGEEDVIYKDRFFHVFQEVVMDNEHVGFVYLRSDTSDLEALATWYAITALIIFSVAVAVAALLWFRLQQMITAPIERLVSAIRDVSETENYSTRVDKRSSDEMGTLIEGFNNMLGLIQDRDTKLGAYAKDLEEEVSNRTAQLKHTNERLLQELTIRKQTETELRVAKEKAEESSRIKSEFLANVSHELRTPLNAILGFTELLLLSDIADEQRRQVELVNSSGDNLLNLIDDVLDLSKIEEGRLSLEVTPFHFGDAIEKIADQYAVLAFGKGIEFILSITEESRIPIIGDEGRIRQILANLVANAIKFTDKGEIELKVFIDSIEGDILKVHFQVRDTGVGIQNDLKGKIFERFTQADGAMTRKFGGVGLGTTIAKQLVDLMDGDIWVESEIDVGSSFHVVLPLKAMKGYTAKSAPELFSSLSAVVVDDNPTSRDTVSHMLEAWGSNVKSVGNGADAIKMLTVENSAECNLLIVDADMPEPDGFEVAMRVMEGSGDDKAKVILLAPANADISARSRRVGVDAYIYKPVKPSELMDAIVTVMTPPLGTQRQVKREAPLSIKIDSNYVVLLAEDNKVNQELIKLSLSKMGLTANITNNGSEAFDRWAKGDVDIILMDVQMPVMDGLSATEAIRTAEEEKGYKRTPIIALTAHAMESDRKRCLDAGMDDYLSKPVRLNALAEALLRNLQKPDGGQADEASEEQKVEYDLEEVRYLCNNDYDRISEFVTLFKTTLEERADDLKMFTAESDEEEIRAVAHQIKGMTGSLKAEKSQTLAMKLEDMSVEDWPEKADTLREELIGEMDILRALLEKEI